LIELEAIENHQSMKGNHLMEGSLHDIVPKNSMTQELEHSKAKSKAI